jgi:adenosylhomocysteine nucleosidase
MLVIKTGMTIEQQIVKRYALPSTVVLTGEFTVDTLDAAVPPDCDAIMSVGVCGGLSPDAQIGQAFIYDACVTPTGTLYADFAWRKRLFIATRYYECHVWSSGQFNTANTITERAALYAQTGCKVIDDETYSVAELAAHRKIPWIGMRTVSDGAADNLPPAIVDALNPDGSTNLEDVIASVVDDPAQIPALLQTATEAQKSFDELRTACLAAGPTFQW